MSVPPLPTISSADHLLISPSTSRSTRGHHPHRQSAGIAYFASGVRMARSATYGQGVRVGIGEGLPTSLPLHGCPVHRFSSASLRLRCQCRLHRFYCRSAPSLPSRSKPPWAGWLDPPLGVEIGCHHLRVTKFGLSEDKGHWIQPPPP